MKTKHCINKLLLIALMLCGQAWPAVGSEGDGLRLVEHVVDGDTLVLEGGARVRLIGVDTPETKHPEIPVQRFGKEASEFTRNFCEGMRVRLEQGPEKKDKYDRLLAYVWVDDVLLNRELIRRGYGYATTRFPHPRMDDFLKAEEEARAKRYGLWNDSPLDGRVANLVMRWTGLSTEGKRLLEKRWDRLLETHPAPVQKENPQQEEDRAAVGKRPPLPEGVVSWIDATDHYGESITVEGKVIATHNSGKACFLNFHHNWSKYFTVVIFKNVFHEFPKAPEELFLNRKIRVKGLIKRHKDKPEILIESADQIEIVEER